ncbi:Formin-like protein 1 [Labeo rohita]|uniref:Formin-like protein 1 n=1 Tax=Labeo rohita TaxID=84645 RepID=A0ABQ8LEP1_LABRO|nr:Formin-like protein 1 [Labeo rohita]
MEQIAVQYRDVIPAIITYLAVVWYSTMMQAHLCPARIESILTAIERVREGQSLIVKQFQRLFALLGLDAMVQTQPRLRLYAFPLIALLPGVLEMQPGWGSSSAGSSILAGLSFFWDLVALLYSSTWEILIIPSSWCNNRRLDPVNCLVGSVLKLLQKTFAPKSCPVEKVRSVIRLLWSTQEGSPAIKQTSSDLPSPLGLKTHLTRSVVASKAFLSGVSMHNICNAAGWSTEHVAVSTAHAFKLPGHYVILPMMPIPLD